MALRFIVVVAACMCFGQLTSAVLGGTIGHPVVVVYPTVTGSSGSNSVEDWGYFDGPKGTVEYPCVLGLDPGGDDWPNYIAAAQSGHPYILDKVVLTKTDPSQTALDVVAPGGSVTQTGSEIRKWWPLVYELPGTTFTLSLSYTTPSRVKLTGEAAASLEHTEIWTWRVAASTKNLYGLLSLFNDLSAGTSDGFVIGADSLRRWLQADVDKAEYMRAAGDLSGLNASLDTFDARVTASEVTESSLLAGSANRIVNIPEVPAADALLATSKALRGRTTGQLTDVLRGGYDGGPVSITSPLIVTLTTADWCYVQNEQRTAGLKVSGIRGIAGVTPGARAILSGVLKSYGPERVLAVSSSGVTVTGNGPIPGALRMPVKCVGGGGVGCLFGFVGSPGLWNGGLLVSVAGTVTGSKSGYFYVDDGSGCRDATSNSGIRVILTNSGSVAPATGSFVCITGVSSCYSSGSFLSQPTYYPALQMAEVTVMRPSP